MAIELVACVEEPRLGGSDVGTDVDGNALAQKPRGLQSDRTEEVDLELEGLRAYAVSCESLPFTPPICLAC